MKKRLIAAILVLFVSVILLRTMYRFSQHNQCQGSCLHQDCSCLCMQRMGDEVVGSPHDEENPYDFGHMVNLIDASKSMSSRVAKIQHGFFSRLQAAPYDDVQSLLAELLRERVRLRGHIWDLKGYSCAGIPVRKYRAFLYYLEVLDDCILAMQTILKRRDVQMRQLSGIF